MGIRDGVGVPLIVTDALRADMAAVEDYEMDMAFGDTEQSFEVTFELPKLAAGAYLYIDGTEYGGIVDGIKADTTSTMGITYTGRTWHGVLAGKVVRPPSGSDYRTFSGDANAAIADIVSHTGLGSLFQARSASSGHTVNYQYARYIDAYTALKDMLASVGCVLGMQRHDGIVELWAEPAASISDEVDSDLMDFTSESTARVVNHLVCLGSGELKNRTVLDLYANASGQVSTTRTFSGVDEVAEVYDYASADAATLLTEGTKRLKGLQVGGTIDVDVHGEQGWRVGDRVTSQNNAAGIIVSTVVTKKIVKVQDGVLVVHYEMGDASRTSVMAAQRYNAAAIASAAALAESASEAAADILSYQQALAVLEGGA